MNKKILLLIVILTVIGMVIAAISLVNTVSHDMSTKYQSGNGSSQNENKLNTVLIEDFKFSPAKITVKKGTTITWINKDLAGHNVVVENAMNSGGLPSDAPLLQRNQSFTHTFNTVGTFEYLCEPHPYMKGTVVVED